MTKLEDSITESMAPYQPKSASRRSKPTPPPLSLVWDVLEVEADSLKLASTQSHDAAAAKGPMLAALQSSCDLSSSVDLDLEGGVTDIWDTSHWDVWRSRVVSLCGRVRRESARRRKFNRNKRVRFYIQQRHIEALRAEQGEPGALGSLLKKVGRKSRVALTPRQVRLARGGAST